ncbi:reticulocyte-binding protein 2-like [Clytia hemisphaerica]|uniref:Uncharacterized protein n=1 Tax=Clytia hemisphaerica TaxID=252671 RepID=A0A7M5V3B3_9CNID|eukprot:TCONS_00027258-protein
MKLKGIFVLVFLAKCVSDSLGNPLQQPRSKLSSFVEEYEKETKAKGENREFQPENNKSKEESKEVEELKASLSTDSSDDKNDELSLKKFNDGPPNAKDVDPATQLNLDTASNKKDAHPDDGPIDHNVIYYDQNMNLVHDDDETKKLFGRACVAGEDKENLIDVISDPNFKLSAGEYKKISEKFLKSVRKILPETTEFPKEKNSKDILTAIRKELTDRRKILEAVATSKTFEDVKDGDPDIKSEINKIFNWIRHYKTKDEEQKRFQRMLKDYDSYEKSDILTEVDRIAINVYSRDPQVNAFLLNPSAFKEGQGKCTLKAHAKLLQNALHKMRKYDGKMLVRIDSNWKKNGEEPLSNTVETFFKFTSTMDISHLKGDAVDEEIKKIALHKKDRLLIRFVDPSQGYEIAPWVKTQYLMSQREVLYPVGATFEVAKTDTKTKDKEFPIGYSLYKYVYDLTDVPSTGV